jgi:hypothetical protein
VKVVRPDPALLWPAYTLFPLALLSVLFFAVAGRDTALIVIALGLLALNAAVVVNQLYLTSLTVSGDELVYRSWAGVQEQRVALGSIQRIDAKRYSGAHGGLSAPHLVARGRDSSVRVNSKPYRLRDIGAVIELIRAANPRVELDAFWSDLASGGEPSKEVAITPRSRF